MDIPVEFKDAYIILPGLTFVKHGFLSFWQLDALTGYVIRSLGNARSLAVFRMSCATWATSGTPPQSRPSRPRKEHSNEIQPSTWFHLVISILNGQTRNSADPVQITRTSSSRTSEHNHDATCTGCIDIVGAGQVNWPIYPEMRTANGSETRAGVVLEWLKA